MLINQRMESRSSVGYVSLVFANRRVEVESGSNSAADGVTFELGKRWHSYQQCSSTAHHNHVVVQLVYHFSILYRGMRKFVLFSVLSLPLRLELSNDPSIHRRQPVSFSSPTEARGRRRRRPPWWMTCSHLHSTQVVSRLSSLILAMLLISRSHPLFRSFGVGQRAVMKSLIQALSPISSYALEHENQKT